VNGCPYATQLSSPQWSGFAFADLAHAVATGADFEETHPHAQLVTPENAECVAAMQNAMATDTADFPSEGSLADIAAARGCTVVCVDAR
jgi:hypothetical protein